VFNLALLDALTEGTWSVPGVGRWRIPEARRTLDYYGINYYGRQFMRWAPVPDQWPAQACDLRHHPREVPERTGLGWDVHPESFEGVLRRLGRPDRPVFVTENGTYMRDDARRWRYLSRHIQAMARAMQHGARVIGYCCWSLLDNFEWAEGFGPRFGIVEMDYSTQQRTVRESGLRYSAICRSNRIAFDP
jgi:beta-glucosidase